MHSLELAVDQWTQKKVLITTAIIQEPSFYFKGVRQSFYELTKDYFDVEFDVLLAQIAFPEIYRHKPLYAVALFHEVGHFFDVEFGIVEATFLTHPAETHHILPGFSVKPAGMTDSLYRTLHKKHRGEFFCDLFATAYAGEAYSEFLGAFAEGNDASFSHPATLDRVDVMRAFLRRDQHVLPDMFNVALQTLGFPELRIRHVVPDVSEAFGNVRPYPITSDEERFGLLTAGWKFLERAPTLPSWRSMSEHDVERSVNDLVEKSLRSHMIVKKWAASAT